MQLRLRSHLGGGQERTRPGRRTRAPASALKITWWVKGQPVELAAGTSRPVLVAAIATRWGRLRGRAAADASEA